MNVSEVDQGCERVGQRLAAGEGVHETNLHLVYCPRLMKNLIHMNIQEILMKSNLYKYFNDIDKSNLYEFSRDIDESNLFKYLSQYR